VVASQNFQVKKLTQTACCTPTDTINVGSDFTVCRYLTVTMCLSAVFIPPSLHLGRRCALRGIVEDRYINTVMYLLQVSSPLKPS